MSPLTVDVRKNCIQIKSTNGNWVLYLPLTEQAALPPLGEHAAGRVTTIEVAGVTGHLRVQLPVTIDGLEARRKLMDSAEAEARRKLRKVSELIVHARRVLRAPPVSRRSGKSSHISRR
ncbi:MAG TPA: hypothetical protein VGP72_19815 [Planctomycetota bacterium]|jgi:hypothetical protein